MLINNNVNTQFEDTILAQQNIRRHANGSIDYSFYDQRARTDRGVAFRAACRSVPVLVRRLIDLLTARPAGRPPQAGQPQVQPRLQRTHKRVETATTSQKFYSEAA